ncbi:MAG TPA: hypothetical protein VFU81_12865 [Thermomicrobiales bacterium]|nr:hypothetical protein [Thermomicrobiales bacterium]
MKVTTIRPEEAPPKPRPTASKLTRQVEQMLTNLKPGTVAKIDREGDETTRGVKASITRAAKRMGKNVDTWDAGGAVFAQLRD